MIKQKTVPVMGTDYMLTQFPAIRGVRVLKQIAKIVGPSLAALQADSDDKIKVAMETLFENLDSAAPVEEILQVLIETVSKGTAPINFDMEFAGEYDRLFLLAKEVVEFNFGSVFTMLGSSV